VVEKSSKYLGSDTQRARSQERIFEDEEGVGIVKQKRLALGLVLHACHESLNFMRKHDSHDSTPFSGLSLLFEVKMLGHLLLISTDENGVALFKMFYTCT